MRIVITDKALAEVLEFGYTADKRYRNLPREAVKGFTKAIRIMESVKQIEDLMRHNGLHFERLQGNRNGQYSVRCNDQYRIVFKNATAEVIITEIEIIEISKHYE